MAIPEQKLSALRCPSCNQPLASRDERLHCTACSETVPVVDGIPHFPITVEHPTAPRLFDILSPFYETPLWFPVLYRIIAGPFAPADDRATVAEFLDPTGDEVLDVACGTGRFTRYVADEAAFVWGIDVSEGMLRTARRYANREGTENTVFARMGADDLRFDRNTFDSVACCWALHLFSDVSAALREMDRVLNAGGWLAGTTLVDDHLLAMPGVREGLRHTVGADVFDSRVLRDLLQRTGFSTVEFERHGAALFFRARE